MDFEQIPLKLALILAKEKMPHKKEWADTNFPSMNNHPYLQVGFRAQRVERMSYSDWMKTITYTRLVNGYQEMKTGPLVVDLEPHLSHEISKKVLDRRAERDQVDTLELRMSRANHGFQLSHYVYGYARDGNGMIGSKTWWFYIPEEKVRQEYEDQPLRHFEDVEQLFQVATFCALRHAINQLDERLLKLYR